MNCSLECVDVLQGNSFTLRLYVTHYDIDTKVEEPYMLEDATDVFVRLVGNNGVVRKFTDLTIVDNLILCPVDGTRLKPGKYGLEVCFKIDGNDKRSYRCCFINVHNCECQADIDTLSEYDIAVAFGADNQVVNVGGLVYAHVDDTLSKTSENPVQNKVITNTLANDYASKQWVIDVMTDGQVDLSSYVSDAELAETLTSYVKNDDLDNTLSSYVKTDVLDETLSSYVKTDVLDETLNSYVKTDDLNNTLSSYVTSQQLDEAIENIDFPETDLSSYVKTDDLNNTLSSYATKQYVDEKVAEIPETDLSNYYNKQEVDNLIDNIPETDLSDYYNKQEIDDKFDNIPETDLSDYYTKQEVDTLIENIDIPVIDTSSYVTHSELSSYNFAYKSQVDNLTQELIDDEKVIATNSNKIEQLTSYFPSYATIDYVNSIVVGDDIDLSAYVTKAELSQNDYAYNSALSDYTTLTQFNESVNNLQSQIDNIEPDVDMTAYVTHDYLSSQSYATSADLNDYYTKTQVDNIVDNIEPDVDLSSYVTWDFLSQQSYITADYLSSQSYATSAELNNLTDDVIDDELVLARAVNDINKVASYLNSYVKISDYNELVNSYNKLYLTVAYLMQNVQWADDSGSQEDFMTGYIIGTATQPFNSTACEALPSTYFSAPSFKVAVPNGKLTGSAASMFRNNGKSNSYITSIDTFDVDTSEVSDMTRMFCDCHSLSSIDVSSFDTSNVTYMNRMFDDCSSLTSLDLSSFDTSNVTNMEGMFSWCEKLTSLDLSGNFDTSKVTNMSAMFGDCDNLTSLDLSNFDTSSVTDMSAMFWSDDNLTSINLSSFNTSNVTTMSLMFSGCHSLSSLNINNFDTSKVTTMTWMFEYCYKLKTLDLSSFNTSHVTDMGYMFYRCEILKAIDMSNFDLSNIANTSLPFDDIDNGLAFMFDGCNMLKNVYVDNMTDAHINLIKRALLSGTKHTFTLSTVDGRKALIKQ